VIEPAPPGRALSPPRRDPSTFPPYLFEAYRSTVLRAPSQPLIEAPDTMSERTGPGPGLSATIAADTDLTRNAGTGGEAVGERIILTGRVLDRDGAPVPNTLVEVWQANAAGRYAHDRDRHDAPLDPNFVGIGRFLTGDDGAYSLTTIRPGAYPWKNDPNAWRPSHVHFSLFGPAFHSRLVTQMYFPGDPLLELDPIFRSVPSDHARARLVARYAHEVTRPEWALGYRFDIVLDGPGRTPFERPSGGGGV
jgi:protocatechuate 3,4-dioxygenase, beta subunit